MNHSRESSADGKRVRELFDLRGRVAVVTGGGSGLGLQMAEALADAGADIVVCARKLDRCERAAAQLSDRYGTTVLGLRCDLREPRQIDEVIGQAISQLGRIDILVNNSGTSWGAAPDVLPLESWRHVLDVNLTGAFAFAQAFGRRLIAQREGGKIINVASVAAFRGAKPHIMDAIAYNASKGGLVAMTVDLAVKWAVHQINVNAIAPGWFPSGMSAAVLERSRVELLDRIPLGRFGGGSDLKGAVVFLASSASDFVTGQTLAVDGGQLAT